MLLLFYCDIRPLCALTLQLLVQIKSQLVFHIKIAKIRLINA